MYFVTRLIKQKCVLVVFDFVTTNFTISKNIPNTILQSYGNSLFTNNRKVIYSKNNVDKL